MDCRFWSLFIALDLWPLLDSFSLRLRSTLPLLPLCLDSRCQPDRSLPPTKRDCLTTGGDDRIHPGSPSPDTFPRLLPLHLIASMILGYVSKEASSSAPCCVFAALSILVMTVFIRMWLPFKHIETFTLRLLELHSQCRTRCLLQLVNWVVLLRGSTGNMVVTSRTKLCDDLAATLFRPLSSIVCERCVTLDMAPTFLATLPGSLGPTVGAVTETSWRPPGPQETPLLHSPPPPPLPLPLPLSQTPSRDQETLQEEMVRDRPGGAGWREGRSKVEGGLRSTRSLPKPQAPPPLPFEAPLSPPPFESPFGCQARVKTKKGPEKFHMTSCMSVHERFVHCCSTEYPSMVHKAAVALGGSEMGLRTTPTDAERKNSVFECRHH